MPLPFSVLMPSSLALKRAIPRKAPKVKCVLLKSERFADMLRIFPNVLRAFLAFFGDLDEARRRSTIQTLTCRAMPETWPFCLTCCSTVVHFFLRGLFEYPARRLEACLALGAPILLVEVEKLSSEISYLTSCQVLSISSVVYGLL